MPDRIIPNSDTISGEPDAASLATFWSPAGVPQSQSYGNLRDALQADPTARADFAAHAANASAHHVKTPAGGGATIFGAGAPSASQGTNGQTYLETLTGNHFIKAGGSWGLILDLLSLYGADHQTHIAAVTDPWPPGPAVGSNDDVAIWAHSGALAERINGAWVEQSDGGYTRDTRAQVYAHLRQIIDTNGVNLENGIVPVWDPSTHSLRLRGRRVYNAFGTPVGTLTGVEEDQYYDITDGHRSVWIKGASVWHQALRESAPWALPGNTDLIPADKLPAAPGAGLNLEQVQDAVAAMIQNGTGITWSYNDATGLLTPTVTGGGGGGLAFVTTSDQLAGAGTPGDPLTIQDIRANQVTSGTFIVGRIPILNANHIQAGTFGVGRIPNLNASHINAGTLAVGRIPLLAASQISNGEFAVARIPDLGAGQITSGQFGTQRIQNHAITAAKIAPETITGDEIAPGAVHADNVESGTLGFAKMFSDNNVTAPTAWGVKEVAGAEISHFYPPAEFVGLTFQEVADEAAADAAYTSGDGITYYWPE